MAARCRQAASVTEIHVGVRSIRSMNAPALEFAGEYSAERFHEKLARHAKRAGSQVVEKALWLYYAAEDPQSPKWAKGIILGALGYFIVPFDGVPDLLLGVGYTDDLGVL